MFIRPSSRLLPAFALTFALTLLPWRLAAQTEIVTRPLARGVTLTQEITIGAKPLLVNILRVHLTEPGVRVRYGQAQDTISLNGATRGREAIHTLAARNKAVAAVNADFFPYTGDPLGIGIRDGELLSEPMEYRVCLGLTPSSVLMGVLTCVGALTTADNQTHALHGINRVPQNGELVALTPTYTATPRLSKPATVVTLSQINLPVKVAQEMQGVVETVQTVAPNQPLPACPKGAVLLVGSGAAAGSLALHAKVGEGVTFRYDLVPNLPPMGRGRFPSRAGSLRGRKLEPHWADVQQAVGGGPWLVQGGEIYVDGEAEDFPQDSFVAQTHPRTAVGVTAEGVLLLVTVDGRQSWSRGASLPEMAAIMKRLGAVNAMNLDGGGSTSMWAAGGIVNAPSDGRLRAVANGLLVYGEPLVVASGDGIAIAPVSQARTSASGGIVTYALNPGEALTFRLENAPADAPIIWGTEDGLGFITQKGTFRSYRAGAGNVTASWGGRTWKVPVYILSGTPAKITAKLSAVPNQPPDYQILRVTVTDRYGNPIANQPVQFAIRGGQIQANLATNADGEAQCDVFWDLEPTPRSLTVFTSNGLTFKVK